MDNTTRSDNPGFARCSLGNGKWFWVTWVDFGSMCDGVSHSTGVASSAAEAEKQATDSLKISFGCETLRQYPTSFAQHVHRRKAIMKRAGQKCNATGTAQLEFVYCDYDSDYGNGTYSSPHRVVKKTKTRVYVEIPHRSSSWEENGTTYHEVDTFVLVRKTLEEQGRAWSRTRREYFYTTTYEERHGPTQTPALAALGLDASCTKEDIHRAYRKRAKKSHPDHGGDADQFKRLQAAYEEALRIIGA